MADIPGTPGDDFLPGTPDDDTITGFDGNDEIVGLAGNDTIDAGGGDDTATGGQGNDTITLGDGFDTGLGNQGDDTIYGGGGNDYIYGETQGETNLGITGNDHLYGGDGDDFIRGGLGDDFIDGGTGSDRVSYYDALGAVHIDLRIQGSAQNTGHGWDTLVNIENTTGSIYADVLIGNNNANWIWSHGGADTINGNAGDDTFWLPSGDGAVVNGGQGVDVISFRGRVDETGTDTAGVTFTIGNGTQDIGRGLVTTQSVEGAEGSEYDDTLNGNGQDNLLSGFTGDDTVNGGGGDDLIYGDHAIREVGENPLSYEYDDPSIFTPGNDTLSGGAGDDAIYGNGGDDVLNGDGGADTLVGGAGADIINGGGGDDQFVYAGASESTSTSFDTIVGANFNNHDVFDLHTAVTSYATLTGGSLDAASFDADLGAAMSSVLTAGRAVLYTATSGSYAGQAFLVVDGDGVAGYNAGSDYVFLLQDTASLAKIGIDDFI